MPTCPTAAGPQHHKNKIKKFSVCEVVGVPGYCNRIVGLQVEEGVGEPGWVRGPFGAETAAMRRSAALPPPAPGCARAVSLTEGGFRQGQARDRTEKLKSEGFGVAAYLG